MRHEHAFTTTTSTQLILPLAHSSCSVASTFFLFVGVSNPAHMIAHEQRRRPRTAAHIIAASGLNTNLQASSAPPYLPPSSLSPPLNRAALPDGCAGVNGGRERSKHGAGSGWDHESLGARLEASNRHCGSGSHGRPFPPAADARLLETNGRHGFLSLRGCL